MNSDRHGEISSKARRANLMKENILVIMIEEINRDTVSSGERKRFRLKNNGRLKSVGGVSPVKRLLFFLLK